MPRELIGHPAVDGDEIGALKQLVEFDLRGAALAYLLGAEVGVEAMHAEEAAAQFGDPPSDIPEADNAKCLAEDFAADEVEALSDPARAQGAVGLANPLGQAEHHAEHVLGDRLRVAARLVDDQDSVLATGVYVDRIVAGAVARHDQEVGRLPQQVRFGVVVGRQFVAGRAGLVDVRSREDWRRHIGRAVVLKAVERHIAAPAQDIGVADHHVRRDVEDAFAVGDIVHRFNPPLRN